MLVKYWMTENPVTVSPDVLVTEAQRTMAEQGIRCLPVLKGERLVGIVTKNSLRDASPSDATALAKHELPYLLSKLKIGKVMHKKVITVTPDTTLEDATIIAVENRVNHLPVMEGERLVGIISDTDIFRLWVQLLGFKGAGLRITIEDLEKEPSAAYEVTDAIKRHGLTLLSLITLKQPRTGQRLIAIRLAESSAQGLVDELEKKGYKLSQKQLVPE